MTSTAPIPPTTGPASLGWPPAALPHRAATAPIPPTTGPASARGAPPGHGSQGPEPSGPAPSAVQGAAGARPRPAIADQIERRYRRPDRLQRGDPLPALALACLDGGTVRLDALARERPLVLFFGSVT
jgi:hypothetical protein